MIAPELLYRMHPEDALKAMIDEHLKRPLKAGYLKLGEAKSLGGLKTSVEVSVDKSIAPVELWERSGTFVFEYNRTNLGAFTQGIDKSIRTALPIQSEHILGGILAPFRIPVDKLDVVPATYTGLGPVTIEADDLSYRWVGQMSATLLIRYIEIAKLITVKHLIIPFDSQFKSSSIKARIALYLNLANASVFVPTLGTGMFDIGTPKVNGSTVDKDNTLLPLTFNGTPYTGTFDVSYQRRSFDTFRKPPTLTGGPLTDKQQLSALLSVQMGCEITAADIRSEAFPTLAVGATQDVLVSFATTSLAYVGSFLVKYRRTS